MAPHEHLAGEPSPPTPIPIGAARICRAHVRVIDLLDAWLFAESEAELGLQAWREADGADRGDAFAAYVAALDREQQAAAELERALAALPRPADEQSKRAA